ncbi:MAG: HEPN domain-containing protein, partial [Spirochaetota bacterium]
MEIEKLALGYFKKARARRKALQVLLEEKSFSDVVRESQELCELLLKGVLRTIGIEPPKFH